MSNTGNGRGLKKYNENNNYSDVHQFASETKIRIM